MNSPAPAAGPLRRLGAMLYDALIVCALQMAATLPFLPLLGDKMMLASEVGALAYVYHAWQLLVLAAFFVFFWTRKGCTLGMQAWGLRIQTQDGSRPARGDALQRLLAATVPWVPSIAVLAVADYVEPAAPLRWTGAGLLLLGFGNYAWGWTDPQRRAWHDRFLRTRIVRAR